MILIPNCDDATETDVSSVDTATINALFEFMDLENERNLADHLIVRFKLLRSQLFPLMPI